MRFLFENNPLNATINNRVLLKNLTRLYTNGRSGGQTERKYRRAFNVIKCATDRARVLLNY